MRKCVVVAVCALFATCASAPAAADFGNVLPLGDSLSWGDAWTWTGGHWGVGTGTQTPIPGGYRDRLYADLHNAGASLQFVGTDNGNPSPALAAAGQIANEGHSGYFTGNLDANLDASQGGDPGYWLTGLNGRPPIFPDTTLLLTGSNDLESGFNPDFDAKAVLDSLLSHLFSLRPTTHVYLGTVLVAPDRATGNAAAPVFNADLPFEVAKFQAQGRSIQLVDTMAALANTDGSPRAELFFDGVHPNKAGYDVLGDTWAAAMLQNQSLNVSGPVTLRPGAAQSLSVGSIAFAGGTLTLEPGELLTSEPLPSVQQDILAGRIVGAGVPLTVAASDAGKTLIVSALPGDANFDGAVNVGDLGALASNYGIVAGATWAQGDFDLSGAVDVGDLGLLATNYQGAAAMSVAAVPEPASAAVVVASAVFMRRRRLQRA